MLYEEPPRRSAWIAPEFLQWPAEVEHMEAQPRGPVRRAYEIWGHADSLVQQPNLTRGQREDIVMTLRRCIGQREGLITRLYHLRRFPGRRAGEDVLDLLEALGLVRSFMARSLVAVRNTIEHEDLPPPEPERCRVLSEFVWYFLKSTDFFVRGRVQTVVCHSKSRRNWRNLRLDLGDPDFWSLEVMADLPASFSLEHKAGWFSITNARIEKVGDRQRRWAHAAGRSEAVVAPGAEDIYVAGDLRGPLDLFVPLVRAFFAAEAVMYEGS